ncbi:DUF6531 domain-containing protein [Hahella sp. CR1]|uniref:DUF6531 domain-containing protein n=1 Tax=Hahella sp. CR1 TaxID=2992807 RepID=UPI00244298FE|nr:DUF6531 domain-containing protein [Hahella sp. CR1]MDG9671422.1 DUF6531 domain-containing protein [Hahella sp. CR1]
MTKGLSGWTIAIAMAASVSTFSWAGNTADTWTGANNGPPGGGGCGGGPPPGCTGGPGSFVGNEGVGDPIHVGTGNVYFPHEVYQSGGRFPLTFSFFYNSRVRPSSSFTYFHGEWTYSYGQRLSFVNSSVMVITAEGQQIIFEDAGAGKFKPTLRNQSVAKWGSLSREDGVYIYKAPNELSYYFDDSGALVKVQNKQGEYHQLRWELVGNQKQATVTHSSGQEIVIKYSEANLPIQLTDPEGKTYSFNWRNSAEVNLLKDIIYPSYTAANDSVVNFHYLDSYGNPSSDWLYQTALESVTDEENWQKAHWSYNEYGHAIQNYLGDESEKSKVVDVTPVEMEGTKQHTAYVKNAYGCKIKYVHHSYIRGKNYPVNPWLNYVQGADDRPGCDMIGVLEHYSKYPGQDDYKAGGLLEGGMPNEFVDNIYEYRDNWDSDLKKHKTRRRSSLNADGKTERTIALDQYTYNELGSVTHIDRYSGPINSLWRTVDYDYALAGSGAYLHGRIQSQTITDRKPLQGLPFETTGRQRTWNHEYSYYDAEGRALQRHIITNPNDSSEAYEYTPEGFLRSFKNAAGHQVQYLSHTPQGLPQTIIDANGVTTTLTYSDRGWLLSTTTEGRMTSYDYYKNGLEKRVTLPGGYWTEYEYNSARMLTRITQSNGDYQTIQEETDRETTHQKTVSTAWFKSGEQTPVRTEIAVYDALDRLVKTETGAGTQTLYYYEDARFNYRMTRKVIKGDSTTPDRAYRYDYHQNGWMEISYAADNSGDEPSVSYEYEDQGNLTLVKDGNGLSTQYLYDGFNQLVKQISPDTGTTLYEYDDNGNLIRQTNAQGVTAYYAYDKLDRLTSVVYPYSLEENITYIYDQTDYGSAGVGRLSEVQDQSGQTNYYYDNLGRVTNKLTLIGDRHYLWEYDYDSAGRLETLRYPSGRQVRYEWDNLSGRLKAIYTRAWKGAKEAAVAYDFSYLPFGGVTAYTSGNGVVNQLGYDKGYRISSIESQGDSSIMNRSLEWNSANNIVGIADHNQSSASQSFNYDLVDRLISAQGAYGALSYSYDNNGNRQTRELSLDGDPTPEITESYGYINPQTSQQDSNRLWSLEKTGEAARSFQYDANGSMLSRGIAGESFAYNKAGRLESYTHNGVTVNYLYNAMGQRVVKHSNSAGYTDTHFLYGDDGQLLAEHDSTGRLIREYIYANGVPISVAQPGADDDSDADGMSDDWERQYFGNLDRDGNGDSDSDGVLDREEFILGLNPVEDSRPGDAAEDSDKDGLPDEWELSQFGNLDQTATDDFDGDGYNNLREYLDHSNPTDKRNAGKLGEDEDGDGMLDQWEFYYFATMSRNGAEDFDGDGFTDVQEFQHWTNPTNKHNGGRLGADDDNDGLLDRWEVLYFATIERDGTEDFDGDKATDSKEFQDHTDPTDPADYIPDLQILIPALKVYPMIY